jgi:hypothetical protein
MNTLSEKITPHPKDLNKLWHSRMFKITGQQSWLLCQNSAPSLDVNGSETSPARRERISYFKTEKNLGSRANGYSRNSEPLAQPTNSSDSLISPQYASYQNPSYQNLMAPDLIGGGTHRLIDPRLINPRSDQPQSTVEKLKEKTQYLQEKNTNIKKAFEEHIK